MLLPPELVPPPKLAKRFEKYQTFDPIEAKAIKIERRRQKRPRNVLVGVLAGTALIGVGLSAYTNNVWDNQEIQASASISIDDKGDALNPENNDNALVFIDGFNTYNANRLAHYLGKAIQPIIDGQIWPVDYNNAPLESGEIADRIIEKADAEGVTSISLIGYSAGGDVAMQVQEEIYERSNLPIETIFLPSVPNGADALRQAQQDQIGLVKSIAWIPGIQYSTPLRFLLELKIRSGSFTSKSFPDSIFSFVDTWNGIQSDMQNSKIAGSWLMIDQLLAIENADLETRINTLGELPDYEARPTIVYLGTEKPGYDYMVNDKKSASEIGSYADAAGIPFLVYNVPGAVHSRIDIANDEYIKVLSEAGPDILASIEAAKSEASLHRVTSPIIQPILPVDDKG